MKTVVLYSTQPILVEGLRTSLTSLDVFAPFTLCSGLQQLVLHVADEQPDLVLIDLDEDVTLETLRAIKSVAPHSYMILWVDVVSTDFALQAIGLGVRGLLRKTLPIDLQMKCLHKVASGELWLEKALSDRLIAAKRVALTPREHQLACLLTRGLKNKEIAWSLGITEGTVKVYLSRLFSKVGVHDRFELTLFALKNLLPASPDLGAPAPVLPVPVSPYQRASAPENRVTNF